MQSCRVRILCLIVVALPHAQAFGLEPSDFDGDSDGKLGEREMLLYVLHRSGKELSDIDKEDPSAMPPQTYGALSDKELQDAAEKTLRHFRKKHTSGPYDFNDVERYFPEPFALTMPDWFNPLLRESYEYVSHADEPERRSRVQGATISYQRDSQSQADVWKAVGAVIFQIGRGPLQALPSVTFNRLSGGENSTNSLIGRFGISIARRGTGRVYNNVRLYPGYATDFDGAAKILTGEVQWEPVYLENDYWFSGITWKPRLFLHSEFGNVYDNGDKDAISDDERFLRLGLKSEFESQLTYRFKLTGKATYLRGLKGKVENSWLITGKFVVHLIPEDYLDLEFKYDRGRQPITQDDTKALTIGLGFKF